MKSLVRAHRLKLGVVFDGGQLLSGMSVAENIALPLRYHRELSPDELAARVNDLLKQMDLATMADRTPGQIGRAWQQRAGLARAMALQPEVLLLDSPLTGLDVRHANWWLGFLDQLSHGHRWMNGRPMTLVVTADDFRPGAVARRSCVCCQIRVSRNWATGLRWKRAACRRAAKGRTRRLLRDVWLDSFRS
ncbi:MAG: ATP-binding cassette domain-containing protein [Saprospirales bacterium]|nr:ATP-binding cassette domain-containing protein [Saprospirales bacterium]